jgi:hypothetical protein
MKVEELSQYGKGLEMPKEGLKKQGKVMFRLLIKEFGIIGFIGLLFQMNKEAKRLKNEFPDVMKYAKTMGDDMDKQSCTIGGLFFAVAKKKGKKYATEFMTIIIQKIAPVSLPAIYQLDELVKCDGDVFTNYKKFNRAIFEEVNRTGVWKNDGFTETENLLELKVTNCANIEIFEALGCPELSTMGCDHDLAGYPLIEDAVQSGFRRPCTLAKGGDCCHFKFY